MVKQISLNRDEAELIVSLLMLTDHYPARNLEDELRKLFGMVDRDTELIGIGKSLDEIRHTILCDLKILNAPMFQGWRRALQKRVAGFDSLGACLRYNMDDKLIVGETARCTTCNQIESTHGMYFSPDNGVTDATCAKCVQAMIQRENNREECQLPKIQ